MYLLFLRSPFQKYEFHAYSSMFFFFSVVFIFVFFFPVNLPVDRFVKRGGAEESIHSSVCWRGVKEDGVSHDKQIKAELFTDLLFLWQWNQVEWEGLQTLY